MSNISTETLNELYPVMGVDNNTQGFRDNFANIKLNLNYAKEELEYLEQHAIKKGESSDFDGMELINATLSACTTKTVSGGLLLDNYILSYTDGQYHTYTIGDDITISLDGWPPGRYANLLLEVSGDSDIERTVSFTGPLSMNTIKYDNNWPITAFGHSLVVSSSITHVVEFWTTDAGSVIYGGYRGQF